MNRFDQMYEGTPPWDIGRPQPALVEVGERGLIRGHVLDSGCGTGDLAIHLCARGHSVVGVDASGKALEQARRKAAEQGAPVSFVQGNVLDLRSLGQVFDTVVDSGMFHTLTDEGWTRYASSLASVIRPGGLLHILCFSDREPDWGGPRRVSEANLRRVFRGGWWIETLTEARLENNIALEGARAWLATVSWNGAPAAGVH